ncbi:MAG: glycosyltransferase family 2 protein [Ignavibacteria bacterium]|jgi:glycosyltransferase involved in cell wall biosynthesis|nr:glycosyltransferase family 2 protein [Ignavibacteria bacterium]MCU7502357.1 glycosyltransferase family 2 protein [Ignavibacteria bacterium]MCU7515078.1 glycosyltransferase family 2 protein [Ignavibacteria bacterium]
MKKTSYVLITAAKNEEIFIENTIKSVLKQSVLPLKWVIVSDGSTDCTDEIVSRYEAEHDFIQLHRVTSAEGRNFASKVYAINIGYDMLRDLEYDFLGILDADITFEPDYYKKLISEFDKDPDLGLAGGQIFDLYDGKMHKGINSGNSVGNAIQFFRRECFDRLGGLTPIANGGEDGVAEISVRMHGWQVKSISHLMVLHHRRTGTAVLNVLNFKFRQGAVEYSLGYHPFFQVLKCIFRMKEKPYVIGSICRFAGFWWTTLKKEERPVSSDFVRYVRKEQIERIANIVYFKAPFKASKTAKNKEYQV